MRKTLKHQKMCNILFGRGQDPPTTDLNTDGVSFSPEPSVLQHFLVPKKSLATTCGSPIQRCVRQPIPSSKSTASPKSGFCTSATPMAGGSPAWTGAPWARSSGAVAWVARATAAGGTGLRRDTRPRGAVPRGPQMTWSCGARWHRMTRVPTGGGWGLHRNSPGARFWPMGLVAKAPGQPGV